MITVAGKVRDVMGADEELAVDDEQIITLIKIAEKKVRGDLFTHRFNKVPGANPNTGALWNGSNTGFTVDEPIMDYDFDRSTTDDASVYWIDSNKDVQTGSVTVDNARFGRLTITQTGGSAIPSSADNVYLDYYTCDEDISFAVMEELGTLWAAHLVRLRLTEPRKISHIDLQSNQRILETYTDQFRIDYYDLLNNYRGSLIKSTEDI